MPDQDPSAPSTASAADPTPPAAAPHAADAAAFPAGFPPVRDDLRAEEPYGAPQLAVPHVLNVNENPFPPGDDVIADIAEAVVAATRTVNRYPDREFLQLRRELGEYLAMESGIPAPAPQQVWAANGSNEVMQQLLLAFGGPGRKLLVFSPHYSMYPVYARDTFTELVTAERGPAPDFALTAAQVTAAIQEHEPNIVILTSPNNPTGTALQPDVITAAAKALDPARGILIIDEAYGEFRREGVPSALTVQANHPHVVVTRTLSKAFSMAGARVGYLVASAPVVDAVRIVRLPYHLSAYTQAVTRAALRHAPAMLSTVDLLREERDRLAAHVRQRGHQVADSDANFILLRTFHDRHTVFTELLSRGVLVREVGPDGWLRVSIGTPDDNAAFRAALEEADPR